MREAEHGVHAAETRTVTTRVAPSTGEVRAGWLPEYTLHLTKTITMRVADFVARDPGNNVTCSCTVCTFTHRGD